MSNKKSGSNPENYLKMMRHMYSGSSSSTNTQPIIPHHQDDNNQQSSSSPSSSTSSSFLKIPRIRLNKSNSSQNNKHAKSSSSSPSSTPHLVNTHVVMQQQQQHHQKKNNHNNNNQIRFNSSSAGGGNHSHHQQQMKMIREELLKRGSGDGEEGEVMIRSGGMTSKVLIKPKKLPNPIKESVAMQSVHKELLLNQKIGRSVLTHKTELQKALEKLAASKLLDEDNNEQSATPTESSSSSVQPPPHQMPNAISRKDEFQRILESRAKLIEEQKCIVDGESREDVVEESEFEMIHKRIVRQ